MKIYAPVKDANGVYASVRFVNGVGETDNPHLIEWFKSHGYKVPLVDTPVMEQPKPIEPETKNEDMDQSKPDFNSMTSDEIRSWAKQNNLGGVIKNTRDKDKLIKLLKE